MKTLDTNETRNVFDEYLLTNEEMIFVRGGEGDPTMPPVNPPVKI